MCQTAFSTRFRGNGITRIRITHLILMFLGLVLFPLTLFKVLFHPFSLEQKSPQITQTRPSMKTNFKIQMGESSESGLNSNIWISMAVCFSSNTRYYGKEQYPYRYALLLSTDLWVQLTNHSILVTIIHNETLPSYKLEKYVAKLNNSERVQVVLEHTRSMDCPLKSQIIRLIPPVKTWIRPNDLFVTSDVDAFPMVPNIFEVLSSNHKIWIFQYQHTLMTTDTLPISFIAMRVQLWLDLLVHDSPESLVSHFGSILNWAQHTWGFDQDIVSKAILGSKLCALPKDHDLYPRLRIPVLKKQIDDTTTCFHGTTWANCNRGRPKLGHVCKWWHFFPSDSQDVMYKKYLDILKLNGLQYQAKHFETIK